MSEQSKQVKHTLIHDSDTEEFHKSLDTGFFKDQEHLLNYILNEIPSNVNNICEIGCGTGIVGRYIKHKLQNVNITFVDCNEPLLDAIPDEVGVKECVDLLQYNPKSDFDCVVSRLMTHYFPKGKHQEIFNKAYELLSDDGCYIDVSALEIDHDTQAVISEFWYKEACWTADRKGESRSDMIRPYVLTVNEVMEFADKVGFNEFTIKRFNDYNLTHTIQDLVPRCKLTPPQVKELEEFLLDQPLHVINNLGIKEVDAGVEITQPVYILKATK
ncbi:methyltransferase domain-containing protein [Candidatus Woesearchaeota archaeon]|jgi:trans-aconitate methyltransferase|nr:methyltransferase domain-containing protein [Candidatus Woesearchaeota archaeon]MBT7062615.1 methyltransferase domain-containing protein [Candidatus Woesearchaeota archaeon]MBT7402774.1 methyltransferase domain-containing protein [Candidatus Woesearchaeota archaeon]